MLQATDVEVSLAVDGVTVVVCGREPHGRLGTLRHDAWLNVLLNIMKTVTHADNTQHTASQSVHADIH